jgi:hypothetical protein
MEPILIGDLMELYQNLSMDGIRVLAVGYKISKHVKHIQKMMSRN